MKRGMSSIEVFSILILCSVSSSIGISMYTTTKIAGIDAYIGTFIGTIIGFIPLLVFLYIFNNNKDRNIYKKNIFIFGNVIGNIINFILIILFFIVGMTILFNLGNFIVSQYLTDTHLLLILILFGIMIYHINNKEIEVIGRVSTIFLFLFLVLFITEVLCLSKESSLYNLKPILEFGLNKPLVAGLINSLITTIPFYTILIIPKDDIIDKQRTTKYLILGYIISSLIFFLIAFVTNSSLGKYLIGLYQYPEYIALKKISIFNFAERIENFLSFNWIISSYIAVAMIINYCKTINYKKKKKKLVNGIITIIIVFLSYYVFKNNTLFNNYLYNIYPYILSSIFIIHLIIFIGMLIKKRPTHN